MTDPLITTLDHIGVDADTPAAALLLELVQHLARGLDHPDPEAVERAAQAAAWRLSQQQQPGR